MSSLRRTFSLVSYCTAKAVAPMAIQDAQPRMPLDFQSKMNALCQFLSLISSDLVEIAFDQDLGKSEAGYEIAQRLDR